ncbi:carboxylesterase family protein [Paenibacillus sp. KQZ6P-2]|uniref:Carboxylic ester hydrolase n=1 Tax=Paenibacillus mangrovi TaxID=2931978 RepID=A0A9X1WMA7_9BACL|nr:carboxylesterase family protein [Paenibacillus mangrovi]MCJ8011514.1 carboxylesterase family protein [Paenibacillus mangrovi]
MAKEFRFDDVPVVETKAGKLKGYSFDGMHIFKGIPYAQAKRFQMPTEVEPWEGVKEVTSYGFVCPLMAQEKPNGELLVPHRYWPQDENCQNLNIWTETLDAEAKKPVLVWLHGGGFTAGSSIEQEAYDGFNMSRHGDVVVVSVNHRLNILGYMDLSPFGEKYANSANAGHADLVAALKWVHENIANFGGDPENVTLFGQSGGGMKTTGLMQIPSADGLFHKAIVMSGVSDGKLLPIPTGDGTMIVKAMLEALGIEENDVEKLETVPYYELVQAYNKVCPIVMQQGGYIGCAPMENDFYKGEPLISGFTEHAKTIPMMVGSVIGEFSFAPVPFNKYELSDEEMKAILTKRFGERTQELIDLYLKAYPEKKAVDLLALDRIFRVSSKVLAKLQAEGQQAPVYLYNFTFEFPYQNGKTAWHCADIPFFFHNADKVEICNVPGVSDKLEKQVFGAVVNFARTGNPNHEGLPHWPAVTAENEPTMIFDRTCEVRHNYDDALLALIEEVLPPFSLAELFAQDVQH